MSDQVRVFYEGDGKSLKIRAVAALQVAPDSTSRIDGRWAYSSTDALEGLVEILAEKHQTTLSGFRTANAHARQYREESENLQAVVDGLRGEVAQARRQRVDESQDRDRKVGTILAIERAVADLQGFLEDLKD